MKEEYKNLSLEKLTEVIGEFFNQKEQKAITNGEGFPFVRKLEPEEVERLHKTLGGLSRSMGDELYQLPFNGPVTGPGGVILYNEAVKRIGNEFINNLGDRDSPENEGSSQD